MSVFNKGFAHYYTQKSSELSHNKDIEESYDLKQILSKRVIAPRGI